MSAPTSNAEFFPSIGSVANKTHLLLEQDSERKDGEEDDDDRPMQEIASLCMSCGEQVLWSRPSPGTVTYSIP